MLIPGNLGLLIVAWISEVTVGHWGQVPGSLGDCPGATGVCVCSPCSLLVLLVEPSLGDDADFSGYGVDTFCS